MFYPVWLVFSPDLVCGRPPFRTSWVERPRSGPAGWDARVPDLAGLTPAFQTSWVGRPFFRPPWMDKGLSQRMPPIALRLHQGQSQRHQIHTKHEMNGGICGGGDWGDMGVDMGRYGRVWPFSLRAIPVVPLSPGLTVTTRRYVLY